MGKGTKLSGCLFIVVVAVLLIQNASAVSYFYQSQSFEVTLYEGGRTLVVSQAVTLYAFEGFVEKINVTLPYGRNEMPDANTTLLAQTTAAKDIAKSIFQSDNETVVEVTLPEKIYAGDDFVIIIRYYIYDLEGDAGVSKIGEKTLGDTILGRTGDNIAVTFKTPIFEANVQELIVKLFPPLDFVPKDWDPGLNAAKSYDPATGRVAILWHITSNIPEQGEFYILFGRPGWGITAFLVIGLLVVVFLYLTVDMMNRLKEKAERGELW